MRVAIPIWDDKISPVLDTASRLLVVEVEDRNEASRFEIFLEEQDLPRRCVRIRDMDVDILICGAVSRPFSNMLMASGVNIIPEISGNAEEVLEAYIHGRLFHSRFFMPGRRKNRFGQGDPPMQSHTSGKKIGKRKRHTRKKSMLKPVKGP